MLESESFEKKYKFFLAGAYWYYYYFVWTYCKLNYTYSLSEIHGKMSEEHKNSIEHDAFFSGEKNTNFFFFLQFDDGGLKFFCSFSAHNWPLSNSNTAAFDYFGGFTIFVVLA